MRTIRPIVLILAVAFVTIPVFASEHRTGEQIYNTFCKACHASGVGGAPRYGNTDDWKHHEDSSMHHLFDTVKKGIKIMPPKGGCSDCSDDELKAAIKYLTGASH